MIAPGERALPTLDIPPPPSDAQLASRGVGPVASAPATTGQQLLEEFIRYGRQRPFEEITRRYAGMVFNVCLRVTKDKHDAEDATQAVFLTLAVQAKRGTDIKALGPWLQQVAKRLSLDVRRGKKRRKTREERHHDEQERRRSPAQDDGLPSADLDELKTILHEELQKLPAKYRLPLVLHYFGGMTREEMAAELNTKPSTLGVRIFRGREMLAGRLNGRGVHLPAGALALAIGYLVKRTVTDAMVATTSHAATALAWGADLRTVGHLMSAHDGGAAAVRVLDLTRRASHVLTVGKVRVSVAVALLAATSAGAGVRAFDLLPPIGVRQVQQLFNDGVGRLVRPLIRPLAPPSLRASVPVPTSSTVAVSLASVRPVVVAAGTVRVPAWPTAPVLPAVSSGNLVASIAVIPAVPPASAAALPAPAVLVAQAVPVGPRAAPASVAVAAVAAAEPAAEANNRRAVEPVPVRVAPPSLASAGGNGLAVGPTPAAAAAGSPAPVLAVAGGSAAAAAVNDFYVPAAGPVAAVAAHGMTAAPAAQVQVVQVPTVGGSVTESNGVVRGYGRVDKTGTLTVTGRVVADGDGHDRTLNLLGFSAVRVAVPASSSVTAATAAATTGFYAADHGRLTLPLTSAAITGMSMSVPMAASTPAAVPVATSAAVVDAGAKPAAGGAADPVAAGTTTFVATPGASAVSLTFGADATADPLVPVNSVRLVVTSGVIPTSMSLLATDRSDAPVPPSVDGATVGLFQVDPAAAPLAFVDLVVRYDDHLVSAVGGSEQSVRLWTLGSITIGNWTPVDAGSYQLDTADHTVSGTAVNVSYFAVTVPPAGGVDVGYVTAHPQSTVANVVPEPAAVATAVIGTIALLGRRRRRASGGRSRG